MVTVKIKRLHEDAVMPMYRREGDSGFDLHSLEEVWLCPGQSRLISTGIAVEVPEGYELQVRPRSGISKDTKLRISNSPGTVDSNYRGEVGVLVDNIGMNEGDIERIEKGMRIAQAVIVPVVRAELVETEVLSDTVRMDQGYGSSGNR